MATTAEDAAPAAAGHGAAGPGMPQLDFSTFPNQIFWLAVALVLIYLILTRIALPRIAGVLADRKGSITNDLLAAEELKLKAKEAEAAYERALAEAQAEAQRIIAETRAEMARDLAAASARAEAEIAARAAESERRIAAIRASAMDSVAEIARDTAQALVEALGGRADAAAVAAAVDARLKE